MLNECLTRCFDIGADGRRVAWCITMTTVYDIPADIFNPALALAMADQKAVSMPDWGQYVKTAVDRERPPTQENWWQLRTAAILRKVARSGPVGVTQLAQAFGGKKDNGVMPNTPGVASRHIIRTALQQLEEAGLVEQVYLKSVQLYEKDDYGEFVYEKDEYGNDQKVPMKDEKGNLLKQDLYSGRGITAAGQKLVDNVAHSVRGEADEQYPGLDKY